MRYAVPFHEQFLESLSPYVERVKFSDNEYVQTFYFNNEEHVVPFEHSIKVRTYLPNPVDLPVLDSNICFLDLKKGKGEDKQKVRLETTLKEAAQIVNEKYSFSEIPLRPYVAVEYLRQHYVPKNAEGIRITLDTNLRYFFFLPNQEEGLEIGREENYTRIEIKEEKPEDFTLFMEDLLRESNAFPIISKKFTAYNFLGLYHIRTAGKKIYKELKDCEIEAKLETDSEEVFQRTKQFFNKGESNFRLPSHFPYTLESASINRYYRDDKNSFKAMFRRDEVEIVRKDEGEVIKDPFGLDCILKRKETKGELVSIDSEMIALAELRGELYRMRKAFWIENPETNRTYHLSLDCCLGPPGVLYEMEVEYTGRYTEPGITKEKEIIEDIAEITKLLIENFSELRPSQLTKQGWLGANQ